MKKRVIMLVCIVALLMIYSVALATPVAAGDVLTTPYQHDLFTGWGAATITYTFQTYWFWDFDKLSVHFQVWAALTALRAHAEADVDGAYYIEVGGLFFKRWKDIFNQYNVALTGGYTESTWPVTIDPYHVEYSLHSTLEVWDLIRWPEGPCDDDWKLWYVEPDRDPVYSAPPLEDFEWGSNGVSLATSGGDVTWGVQASGSSKAVITTTHKHGTRGGKLYCDGDHTVIASYQQSPAPTYRAFYIKKDDDAYFHTGNTHNWRRISVTIDTDEWLKYYDTSFHNVCRLDDNTWYLIELRNINYSASTFDIYVYDANGLLESEIGATMSFSWGMYSPVTYSSATTSGGQDSVYLDDIH
jgi:hypothetical protein